MTETAHKFLLLKTDLFVSKQPDEGIDHWSLGGDCAGWLIARLLPVDGIKMICGPLMEDWGGWTFGLTVNRIEVWVQIWPYFGYDQCWLIGIDGQRRRWRRNAEENARLAESIVANAVDRIVREDGRIEKFEWFKENPFDLDIRNF